jgi:exoribonuclease-2
MSRQHVNLDALAHRAMQERGLQPDFPKEAVQQADQMKEAKTSKDGIRDLRKLLWCSIDNDDSRDLDQLTVAEDLGGGRVRILVAIADVDALVKKGTPIDKHAAFNTTSVYTPTEIFPMLPERLSTDLTSLNPDEERYAVVITYVVDEAGSITDGDVYRAWVFNHAKLAYNSVAAWLEDGADMPPALAAVKGMAEQIELQDRIAQRLRTCRYERGALELQTIETKAKVEDGQVQDVYAEPKNRAKELIEDFMIAANGVTTEFLTDRGFPTFRRVVQSPERWDRLERLALEDYGWTLPSEPNSKALAKFLEARRQADPERFPDLSLTVVKLMGRGEYAVQLPKADPMGHFGLAVRNYSHSTAPNRRFPDLITQRLLKAAMEDAPCPYKPEELVHLASHCTLQEDNANKVERQMRKSAAAAVLSSRIGEKFDGLVTGASEKGTWARIFNPPVEGRIMSGWDGLDVGDKVRVKLVEVNIERGFIDFVKA